MEDHVEMIEYLLTKMIKPAIINEERLAHDFCKIVFPIPVEEESPLKFNQHRITKLTLYFSESIIQSASDVHYALILISLDNGEKHLRQLNPPYDARYFTEMGDFPGVQIQRGIREKLTYLVPSKKWGDSHSLNENYQYIYSKIHNAMLLALLRWHDQLSDDPTIKVLVFGCGKGLEILKLATLFEERSMKYSIVGFDLNEDEIAKAKEHCNDFIKSGKVTILKGNHINIKPLLEEHRAKDPSVKTVTFFSGAINRCVIKAKQILPILWQLHQYADVSIISGLTEVWFKAFHAKHIGFNTTVEKANITTRPTRPDWVKVFDYSDIYVLTPMSRPQRIAYLEHQYDKHGHDNRVLDLSFSANPLNDLEDYKFKQLVDLIDLSYANLAGVSEEQLIERLQAYKFLKVVRWDVKSPYPAPKNLGNYVVQLVDKINPKQGGIANYKKMNGDRLDDADILDRIDDQRLPVLPTRLMQRLNTFPFFEASSRKTVSEHLQKATDEKKSGNHLKAKQYAYSVISMCELGLPNCKHELAQAYQLLNDTQEVSERFKTLSDPKMI